MSLSFGQDQEHIGKEAIADVRNDNTDTNWCLFSYQGPKSQNVVFLAKGNGGVPEMVEHLKDDIVGYGLVRKTEVIDDSTTVKFAFIMWLPDNVGRMQKARISVHKGGMQSFIGQVHVDINASSLSEISDKIIELALAKASGTHVSTLADDVAQARIGEQPSKEWIPRSSNTSTKVASIPKTTEKAIKFVNEEGVRADIKDVRSDSTPTNWFLAGYEGKKGNTIIALGKGSGGLDEILPLLEDDMVGYVLLRQKEKIDESETVKFVFIEWSGPNIDRMHKARLSTHKGAVNELFSPYHVDILQASDKSEVTQEIIDRKIKEAAGTMNKVKG
jgi:hypothetical protein